MRKIEARGRKITVGVAFGALVGCSSSGKVFESADQGTQGAGGGAGASSGGAAASSGGAAGSGPEEAGGARSTGGAPAGSVDAGACAAVVFQGESIQTDLYVLLDRSSSMTESIPGGTTSWWDATRSALESLFAAPASAGTGVGLQYFPLGGVAPGSCTADYSTPSVEIAPLPANGAVLAGSLDATTPGEFTPTGPALAGAIGHMKAWGSAHPGRALAVLLATDGFPTECEPQSLQGIAAIAANGFSTLPPVRTIVLGLNLGSGIRNLDGIAAAGGSDHAIGIDGPDVSAQIRTASLLSSPTSRACTFPVVVAPGGGAYERTDVLVNGETIPKRTSAADCGASNDGYYVGGSTDAPTIELCPHTCGAGPDSVEIRYCR